MFEGLGLRVLVFEICQGLGFWRLRLGDLEGASSGALRVS